MDALAQRLQAEALVHGGDDHGAERADARRLDRCGDAAEEQAQDEEDQKDRRDQIQQQAQLLAQVDPLFLGQRRAEARVDPRAQDDIADIHAGQHQARHHRAQIEPAHRLLRHHGVENGQDGRRDEDAEGAAGHDRAEGDLVVVIAPQHGRQGDDAHGYHRGADHPHHGRQNGGRDDGGRRQAAPQATHPLVDDVEHLLDQPGAFEHRGHEDEERDGRQVGVGHQGIDAYGDDVDHGRAADQINEDDPQSADHERHRQAHHQQQGQGAEHEERQMADADVGQHLGEGEQEAFVAVRVVKQ